MLTTALIVWAVLAPAAAYCIGAVLGYGKASEEAESFVLDARRKAWDLEQREQEREYLFAEARRKLSAQLASDGAEAAKHAESSRRFLPQLDPLSGKVVEEDGGW